LTEVDGGDGDSDSDGDIYPDIKRTATASTQGTRCHEKQKAAVFVAQLVNKKPRTGRYTVVWALLGCGIPAGTFLVDRNPNLYKYALSDVKDRAEWSELCNRLDQVVRPTNMQLNRYSRQQCVIGMCAISLSILFIFLCLEGQNNSTNQNVLYYTMGWVSFSLLLLAVQRHVFGLYVFRAWSGMVADLEQAIKRENQSSRSSFGELRLQKLQNKHHCGSCHSKYSTLAIEVNTKTSMDEAEEVQFLEKKKSDDV